ncbi:MAG: hypothetical protein RLZZ502_327 [Pseudomonadota bacterium]|jgi:alkaline phosphatase D
MHKSYPKSSKRREFLSLGVVGAGLPAVVLARTSKSAGLYFAPALFELKPDSVKVWVSGAGTGQKLHVRYSELPDRGLGLRSAEITLNASTDQTGTMALAIQTGKHYAYAVYEGDVALSSVAEFAALPTTGVRLAFSGDMEENHRPFTLFDSIRKQQPNVFLHLGDTCYADHPKREFVPSVAHYRRKHSNVRKDEHLQGFMQRVPQYAIWDDHETANDCHGGHPNMDEAEQVFREYWACDGVAKGFYRNVPLHADMELIILDCRRFRSPQSELDNSDKSMLGKTQLAWFLNRLEHSKAKVKLVASSVPFHGGGADTWGNYKTERKQIVDFIVQKKIHTVVFLSADYHFARDWSNAKTGIYEFMVGPVASFLGMDRNGNRERHGRGPHASYGDGVNYGLIELRGQELLFECRDLNNEVRWSRTLSI